MPALGAIPASQDLTGSAGIWPVGSVAAYLGNTPPAGWLLCTGITVPISSYPALYDAIGNTWNRNASTGLPETPADGMFKLPDLRRAIPIGNAGTGATATAGAVGKRGGSWDHTHGPTGLAPASHSHGAGSIADTTGHYHDGSGYAVNDHTHVLYVDSLDCKNSDSSKTGSSAYAIDYSGSGATGGIIGTALGGVLAQLGAGTATGSTASVTVTLSNATASANPAYQTVSYIVRY